jgi:hypothetical protein
MSRQPEFERLFDQQEVMERLLKRWMVGQTVVIITLLGAMELAR